MEEISITQELLQKAQGFHTERQWQRKFFAMGACCYYCGDDLKLAEAHQEHKIPRCRGGSDNIGNIVPSCHLCNQLKGWRTDREFFRARPALYAAHFAQGSRTKDKPKPCSAAEVIYNEPDLLRRLIRERDGRVSWAWAHPA